MAILIALYCNGLWWHCAFIWRIYIVEIVAASSDSVANECEYAVITHRQGTRPNGCVHTQRALSSKIYVCTHTHTHTLQGLMTSACVCAHKHALYVLSCEIERLSAACSHDVGEKLITRFEYGDGRDWRRRARREITMWT